MAAAEVENTAERTKPVRSTIVVALSIAAAFLPDGCTMDNSQNTATQAERADVLVAAFGRRLGVYDAHLGPNHDRSFGDCGFHYNPETDILSARVFVAKAYLKDNTPEKVENFRKVARALNDPRIGGLFEKAGGYFVLDEEKQRYFLVKDFPVSKTSERQFREEMEDLLNLGATWSMRWFGRVAEITHGVQPPPDHAVTRKNDK